MVDFDPILWVRNGKEHKKRKAERKKHTKLVPFVFPACAS
jgi:hypothetical protein